jgi:hypothetical protein
MLRVKIILISIGLSTLLGCATSKPHIEYVPMPVETVRYKSIPPALLKRHCSDLGLSDLVTQADVERALATAWLCIQDHNADKDEIESLE